MVQAASVKKSGPWSERGLANSKRNQSVHDRIEVDTSATSRTCQAQCFRSQQPIHGLAPVVASPTTSAPTFVLTDLDESYGVSFNELVDGELKVDKIDSNMTCKGIYGLSRWHTDTASC